MKAKTKVLLLVQVVLWVSFVIFCARVAQDGAQRFGAFLLFAGSTLLLMAVFIKQILALLNAHAGGVKRFLAGCSLSVVFLMLNFGGSGIAINVLKASRLQERFVDYRRFVSLVEDGTLDVPFEMANITVPDEYRNLGKVAIAAERNTNGTAVIFVTEPGFMGKFPGYLYVSSGSIRPGSWLDEMLCSRSRIDTNWFDVSFFKLTVPVSDQ